MIKKYKLFKRSMLPRLTTPVQNQSFHIDSVIPAGVSSDKMRQSTTKYNSRLSSAVQPTSTAGKMSKQSMKKSMTSGSVAKVQLQKPQSRGASQNQRRQLTSSISQKQMKKQIGGELLSTIPPSLADTNSHMGSIKSPQRSSVLGMSNPRCKNTSVASNRFKNSASKRKLISSGSQVRSGSNYKVSRYLSKVQKMRLASPELQFEGDFTPSGRNQTPLQLPLIMPDSNKAYEEFKAGKITHQDFLAVEQRSSSSVLLKPFSSRLQSIKQSPSNKKRGTTPALTTNKQSPSPSAVRRNKRRYLQTVVNNASGIKDFQMNGVLNEASQSKEQKKAARDRDSTDFSNQNFYEIKLTEQDLGRGSNDEKFKGGRPQSSPNVSKKTKERNSMKRSSTHEQLVDNESRNVFSAPHIPILPWTSQRDAKEVHLNRNSMDPHQQPLLSECRGLNTRQSGSSLLHPSETGMHLDGLPCQLRMHHQVQSMPNLHHPEMCGNHHQLQHQIGSHLLSPVRQSCCMHLPRGTSMSPEIPLIKSQSLEKVPMSAQSRNEDENKLNRSSMSHPIQMLQQAHPSTLNQFCCGSQCRPMTTCNLQMQQHPQVLCVKCQQMPAGYNCHQPVVHYIVSPQQIQATGGYWPGEQNTTGCDQQQDTTAKKHPKKRRKRQQRMSESKQETSKETDLKAERPKLLSLKPSMSVHVQTMPEMRVIETQTDPVTASLTLPNGAPQVQVSATVREKKQIKKKVPTLRVYDIEKSKTLPDSSLQINDQKSEAGANTGQAIGSTSLLAPAKTGDTTTMSARLRANDLPPADMLIDHIERVSQRFKKVKKALGEESQINSSFVSKCSFRNSDRKRGQEARYEQQLASPMKRKGTFDTSADSDEYIGQTDQYLKCEDAKSLSPETANSRAIKLDPDKHDRLLINALSEKDKQYKGTELQRGMSDSPTLRKESLDLSSVGKQGRGDHFSAYKIPRKPNEQLDENDRTLLSPIENSPSQLKQSQLQLPDPESPKIVMQNIICDEQPLLLTKRHKTGQMTTKTISIQDQNLNGNPAGFDEVNGGFQTNPKKEMKQRLLDLTSGTSGSLRTSQIDRLGHTQNSSVSTTGTKSGESGTFSTAVVKNKSILKTHGLASTHGERTKSIRLQFNQIDEDSSEEGGPPSDEESRHNLAYRQKVHFGSNKKSSGRKSACSEQIKDSSGKKKKRGKTLALSMQRYSDEKSSPLISNPKLDSGRESSSSAYKSKRSNDSCAIETSSDSDATSESSNLETRGDFIRRIQEERKRIVAQSANKVPEMYQHYFQTSDKEEDQEKAKKKARRSRKRQNASVMIKTNAAKGRPRRRSSSRKFELKRQNTIAPVMATALENNLHRPRIGSTDLPKEETKAQPPQYQQKRLLDRSQSFEPRDKIFKRDLLSDLKKYAQENGVPIKKQTHHKKDKVQTLALKSKAEKEKVQEFEQVISPDHLKLRKKMSNGGNTTIRELPGLEGGTSYNSPLQSVIQSPLGSGVKELNFRLHKISSSLSKDGSSSPRPAEFMLSAVPDKVRKTTSEIVRKPSQKLAEVPGAGFAETKSGRKSSVKSDKEEMSKLGITKEERMLKPFLKKKSSLPFLKVKAKTQKSVKRKAQDAALNVYMERPTILPQSMSTDKLVSVKRLAISQSQKAQQKRKVSVKKLKRQPKNQ